MFEFKVAIHGIEFKCTVKLQGFMGENNPTGCCIRVYKSSFYPSTFAFWIRMRVCPDALSHGSPNPYLHLRKNLDFTLSCKKAWQRAHKYQYPKLLQVNQSPLGENSRGYKVINCSSNCVCWDFLVVRNELNVLEIVDRCIHFLHSHVDTAVGGSPQYIFQHNIHISFLIHVCGYGYGYGNRWDFLSYCDLG